MREWPSLKQKGLTRKNSSDSLASSMYSQNTQNMRRYEPSSRGSVDGMQTVSSIDSRENSQTWSNAMKQEGAFNTSFRKAGIMNRMGSMKSTLIGQHPLRQIVEGGRVLTNQHSIRSDTSGPGISDVRSSDDPLSQQEVGPCPVAHFSP